MDENINVGSVMVSKKGLIRVPDEVIEKLKLNIKIDAIGFIWDKENNEFKLKVVRG